MLASNVDKIRDYFSRQYEVMEGGTKENIYALFAEDAVIRLDDGDTMTPEDVVRSAAALRQIPRSERTIEVSDFREEGDTVTFHSFVRFRNPETGKLDELGSDVVWRFNDQGKVIESRSKTSIAKMLPVSKN
jgi:ketosteroid isomerase-like protein